MIHVITRIKRPERDLVEKFAALSAATVHEASGKKGAVDSSIKPITSGMKICGPAFTVQCAPGDNLMLHKALATAETGDVIIASVGGAYDYGYFGELMATSARVSKIAGLAIDGSVRDSLEIIEMGFPVFSRNTSIRGTRKETLGVINYPLNFGGITINPGDIILGDDDGIVVINLNDAEEVLERARQRVKDEVKKAEILASGVSSIEYNHLDRIFEKLGLVEE